MGSRQPTPQRGRGGPLGPRAPLTCRSWNPGTPPSFPQGRAPGLARRGVGRRPDPAPAGGEQVELGQVRRAAFHPGPALPSPQQKVAQETGSRPGFSLDGTQRCPGPPNPRATETRVEEQPLYTTQGRQFSVSSSHKIGIALIT